MKTKRRKKVKFLATFLLFVFVRSVFFRVRGGGPQHPPYWVWGYHPNHFPLYWGRGPERIICLPDLGNLIPLTLPRGSWAVQSVAQG